MLNYRSVDDLNKLIRANLSHIPRVDAIVGIPRSGMLPASLIALYLGKPLLPIEHLFIGGQYWINLTARFKLDISNIHSVLIVDDSCNTGNAMQAVKVRINTFVETIDVKYAAIYVTEQGKKNVDFYFEQVDLPRVFEWNIMDHIILMNSCVDMDGVLCVDPTPEQNDDGEKYLQFIQNAVPIFTPKHTIKAIVTARLEKYRAETEAWLNKHGIKYNRLYMMNYPTMQMRRWANNHAQYKAEIYRQVGAQLFIESNLYQADIIHTLTNKPVYCLEDNSFHGGD